MIETLSRTWALLLGVMFLMVGNGIQGTLLGVRGSMEGFSTFQLSLVMSAYFAGFLGGSRFAPDLIRRVGHVRVFAALGSFISAILILYPTVTNPWAWIGLRVLMGFCFSGVYVTAESWLNNATSNANRGLALSLYMVAQMIGIISAQGLMTATDPSGFIPFVIPSVLVSIAFAPILLSITPTPAFERTRAMGVMELFRISPLSCVGVFLLGGVFSTVFGMASVYGGQTGLSVNQISTFVAAVYVGGLIAQFPLGLLSDRIDRRRVILYALAVGMCGGLLGAASGSYTLLVISALIVGGTANPLYGLFIAYGNDHLDADRMAAASGRFIFLNGIGATSGPLLTGWLMGVVGPVGFWFFIAALYALLLVYGIYRSFRRPARRPADTGNYAPVLPVSTAVAVSAAQEYYVETSDEETGGNAGATEEAPVDEETEPLPAPGAPAHETAAQS
ncbi:MAG: MFS transporter [Rhodobacteraceae bacterium]|nr:MFS transporter [Paracoccaceae bacterium]